MEQLKKKVMQLSNSLLVSELEISEGNVKDKIISLSTLHMEIQEVPRELKIPYFYSRNVVR